MVEFLQEINGEDFTYEKGKRYVSIDDFQSEKLKDVVLVRQPNSPKGMNWWTSIPKSQEGILFKTIDDNKMSILEMIEENKILGK